MFHYIFTAESDGKRILKIDVHFVKLSAIKYWFVFYETQCMCMWRSCTVWGLLGLNKSVESEAFS